MIFVLKETHASDFIFSFSKRELTLFLYTTYMLATAVPGIPGSSLRAVVFEVLPHVFIGKGIWVNIGQ